MPTFFEKAIWLLKKAGKSIQDDVAYYYDNPGDIPGDVWAWIKDNKLTCACILGGILIIVIPPAIGFTAAGPAAGSIAAGWQASIGNVVAGSLFSILQSLSMTGVFTSIGAWMIGLGGGWKVLRWIGGGLYSTFAWLSESMGIGFTQEDLKKKLDKSNEEKQEDDESDNGEAGSDSDEEGAGTE